MGMLTAGHLTRLHRFSSSHTMFRFEQVNVDVVALDVLGPLNCKGTHLIVHKVCFVPFQTPSCHGMDSLYVMLVHECATVCLHVILSVRQCCCGNASCITLPVA